MSEDKQPEREQGDSKVSTSRKKLTLQEKLGLPTKPYAVVGSGDRDEVAASRIIYKNKFAKKSLSVYHLQRRLAELGYSTAIGDPQGYYGDGTLSAVQAFQEANKWGLGDLDREQLEKLFEGDPNVVIVD